MASAASIAPLQVGLSAALSTVPRRLAWMRYVSSSLVPFGTPRLSVWSAATTAARMPPSSMARRVSGPNAAQLKSAPAALARSRAWSAESKRTSRSNPLAAVLSTSLSTEDSRMASAQPAVAEQLSSAPAAAALRSGLSDARQVTTACTPPQSSSCSRAGTLSNPALRRATQHAVDWASSSLASSVSTTTLMPPRATSLSRPGSSTHRLAIHPAAWHSIAGSSREAGSTSSRVVMGVSEESMKLRAASASAVRFIRAPTALDVWRT
mmetsp:Transcript_19863/g.50519  ORF Transcript_19863/g.50519 Transcript_19863/m.50519 type:complete len:266 (+) Transcript_19863:1010-1807(+)